MYRSEKVARVFGLTLYSLVFLLLLLMSGVLLFQGHWKHAVLAIIPAVGATFVLHMNTRRRMDPVDRRRFGWSGAWGGPFFDWVYFHSKARDRIRDGRGRHGRDDRSSSQE